MTCLTDFVTYDVWLDLPDNWLVQFKNHMSTALASPDGRDMLARRASPEIAHAVIATLDLRTWPLLLAAAGFGSPCEVTDDVALLIKSAATTTGVADALTALATQPESISTSTFKQIQALFLKVRDEYDQSETLTEGWFRGVLAVADQLPAGQELRVNWSDMRAIFAALPSWLVRKTLFVTVYDYTVQDIATCLSAPLAEPIVKRLAALSPQQLRLHLMSLASIIATADVVSTATVVVRDITAALTLAEAS